MTDRELNARLAELMELDVHRDFPCWRSQNDGYVSFARKREGADSFIYNEAEHAYRPDPLNNPWFYTELSHYSTDLNAVREVEMRVLEMNYRPDPLIGSETEKPFAYYVEALMERL